MLNPLKIKMMILETKFCQYTAVALRKTWLLQKQIKNRASVRKCYQGLFFIANMQFNNPTSSPQT